MATGNPITIANRPLFLQAVGADPAITYSAKELRNLIGAVFPRTGTIGTGFRVAARSTPNLQVDVSAGWFIHGGSGSDKYVIRSDSTDTLDLTGFNTAPAATRTHRIWLALYDKSVSGNEYTSKLWATEDTGSGAPNPADNPTHLFELATITYAASPVTAITNAMITNTVRRASYGTGNFDLPLAAGIASGFGTLDSGPPRYTMSGSRIYGAGAVVRTPAANFTSGNVYSIGTLPVGYRPKFQRYCSATGHAGNMYRLTIGTDGLIQATIPAAPTVSMQWLGLDGMVFELD